MQKAKTFTSPFGKAIYPHLTKCDVRFKPEGEYKVDLELGEAPANNLVKILKEYQVKAVSEAKDKTGKKEIKTAPLPYKQEDDKYVFKFKMKASGTNGKTGETFKQRPALFDSELKPINPEDTSIWGGSILRVSFQPFPWFTPALGAGVSLRLKSVQVKELVEGGGQTAEASGFDKVDGYSNNTGSDNVEVQEEVSSATDF